MTTLEAKLKLSPNRYLGCFGEYRRTDPICRKWCALTVRCIIEQDQNQRFEIIEELISGDAFPVWMN
ncbi:hypothetical protein LJC71_05920 [Desulfosarcina sp. OttesenSCG-928-A07]|nr:hypothetical protein [Desulfosarcina sp. OttesenSCG-928-A07]